MRQDRDVLDALQADLAELTALQAPSGSEQPVIARLRDLFTPLVDTVTVDHMGNLTATREGSQGAPHVVVSAHADEIGALVARIEPEGFLRLLPLGGVQPRLLEGRAVWVGGRTGVIGARSGHLTPASEHGQGIAHAIQQTPDEELLVEHGAQYPALQRLEERCWISAKWGTSSNNRKARFYSLTAGGRKQLVKETAKWKRLATAIARVLGAEES